VYTAVVNNVDTYGLAALATTPNSIIAVVPRYMVRMDDVGPHTVTAQLTSAGTTVTLPNYNPSNTYVYQQAVYTLDPNTSAAWSAAAVNALLLSIKDIL
jgi:ABC-type hemin transport system substrate-binding protein